MPSGFRALRYDEVSSSFCGADRLWKFPDRVHNFGPYFVSALKVFSQILIFSCPRKSNDRRLSAQGDGEHILFDLKQQMIDAERFVGSLADGSNLGIEGRSVEC